MYTITETLTVASLAAVVTTTGIYTIESYTFTT
jgi:hypothetical protein